MPNNRIRKLRKKLKAVRFKMKKRIPLQSKTLLRKTNYFLTSKLKKKWNQTNLPNFLEPKLPKLPLPMLLPMKPSKYNRKKVFHRRKISQTCIIIKLEKQLTRQLMLCSKIKRSKNSQRKQYRTVQATQHKSNQESESKLETCQVKVQDGCLGQIQLKPT